MNSRNVTGHSFAIAALACVSLAFGQRIEQVRAPLIVRPQVLFSPQVIEAFRPDISISFAKGQGSEKSILRMGGSSVEIVWNSKNDQIKRGVYQVSSKPFDLKSDWRRNANLVASGDLNFYPQGSRTRTDRTNLVALNRFSISFTDTGVLTQFSNVSGKINWQEVGSTEPIRRPLSGIQLVAKKGKPLDKVYVRVVGIDSNGTATTGASNVLVVNFIEPLRIKMPIKAPVPGTITPYKFVSARQTQNDFYRHIVVTRDYSFGALGPFYVKGQKIYLAPKSSSGGDMFSDFVDSVGGTIGAFVDVAGNVVNPVSAAMFEIKHQIFVLVTTMVTSIIAGVDEELIKPMVANLDNMFVSVGLPPTVSNVDYLLRETDYYTNVYADLTIQLMQTVKQVSADWAVDQSKTIVKSYIEKVKAVSNAELFRPDPDFMYRPASFVAIVRNGENVKTRRTKLDITDTAGFFEPVVVSVPPMNPGDELAIPVFLTPTLDPDRWIKFATPPFPFPPFNGLGINFNSEKGYVAWDGNKLTDEQKKYDESVKAWAKSVSEKEAIRKSWENIYSLGKGSNGSSLSANFVLSIEGKVLKTFKQNLGG